MTYERHDNITVTSTPYPNNGVILQSLNYIQMDAFSSLFPHNNNENLRKEEAITEEKQQTQMRESAVLTSALVNIENNFRSLF